jgi:hypothetical protein
MADPDRHEVTTDEELSEQLHQLLIVDGRDSVEVIHPIQGRVIVTAESYKETCQALEEVRTMSPAQRLQAKKKHERKRQKRLVNALNDIALYHTVDITDEDNFGRDISGNEIDISGCYFLPRDKYPPYVTFGNYHNEVGAFIEQNEQHDVKPPIRILHQGGPLSEALQQLADECTEEERQALLDNLETIH